MPRFPDPSNTTANSRDTLLPVPHSPVAEPHEPGTPQDDPAEGARDQTSEKDEVIRRRADVPLGPSEHDRFVDSSVAQGD